MSETITEEKSGALAQSVGVQIRLTRKLKSMTLNELARKCGTTPQTIQRLEVGNMTLSVDWIEIICIALNIEPYELCSASRHHAAEQSRGHEVADY